MMRMIMRHEEDRVADREKVAALMMRLSLATGHGDTLDDLLATLEGEIARRFQREYERGRLDATMAIIEQQAAPPWYAKGNRTEHIHRVGIGRVESLHRTAFGPTNAFHAECPACGAKVDVIPEPANLHGNSRRRGPGIDKRR